MQEKTILTPEITEIVNFENLTKHICLICETWHNYKKSKCIFCTKHKFKKGKTLVFNFKPILIQNKNNIELKILKFNLLSNKFDNIFFNSQNLNFFIKTDKNSYEKNIQIFDIFLDHVYKILNIQNLNKIIFKKKFTDAFDCFVEKNTRPDDKKILMPLFDCKINRRKIINLSIENFFK